MPVTLRDALSATDFDVEDFGVLKGRNDGCLCFAVGAAFSANDVSVRRECWSLGVVRAEELVVRLGREEGLEAAGGSGVLTTGAGTAAVYSARGQKAAATPEPRTPISATGATTRATRTIGWGRNARRGRGCSARRGRGPAKVLLTRVARPKRYLCAGV